MGVVTTPHLGPTVEIDGISVRTVGKQTRVSLGARRFGVQWQWTRPSFVEAREGDRTISTTRIRDHVVEARVAVVAVTIAGFLLKRRHHT